MAIQSILAPENDCRQRGGISKMYVTESANVLSYVFNSDHELTSIVMDSGQADPTWKLITFEKDTAFFTQDKTVPGGVNVAQVISFVQPKMTALVRKGLYLLNQACAIHCLVLSNEGDWMLFGVSYYPSTNTWETEKLQAATGSGNSGDNPAETSGAYIETLAGNANFYAPFSLVEESALAVPA